MQLNNTIRNTQAGNVFVFILAGIFLFGALIFTFTRGASKGTTNLGKHQARVAAQEIMGYAQSLEQGVNRVRRNGCSENQISFENSEIAGYPNANAPGDNSCHVFEENGGRAIYQAPNDMWLDGSFTGGSSFGDNVFTGNLSIDGVETANMELLFYVPYVSNQICEALNRFIGLDLAAIPVDDYGGGVNTYTGSFTAATTSVIGDDATDLAGQSSFCVRQDSSGINIFFHTLLAR